MNAIIRTLLVLLTACHVPPSDPPPQLTCAYHTLRAHEGKAELYERTEAPSTPTDYDHTKAAARARLLFIDAPPGDWSVRWVCYPEVGRAPTGPTDVEVAAWEVR